MRDLADTIDASSCMVYKSFSLLPVLVIARELSLLLLFGSSSLTLPLALSRPDGRSGVRGRRRVDGPDAEDIVRFGRKGGGVGLGDAGEIKGGGGGEIGEGSVVDIVVVVVGSDAAVVDFDFSIVTTSTS